MTYGGLTTICGNSWEGGQLENMGNAKMTTLLNYMTQNSFLLKPDTLIASSGKLLNLKCTHTTSTEKMA